MTLPQKKLRKIKVGGKDYAWIIRSRPTWNQGLGGPMTLAIQQLDVNTPTILRVMLNVLRPDNWLQTTNTVITPNVIQNIIKAALKDGWKTDEGSAFDFKYQLTEKQI